jgi:hypothetical protein
MIVWPVLALGLGALVWWFTRPPAPAPLPPAVTLTPEEQRDLAERMAARVEERERGDPHPRTAVPAPAPSGKQVRVRVVDADTGQPIAQASAVDMSAGAVVARAQGDGLLTLPVEIAARVAFAAAGYLAKLPQPGEEDAVEIETALAKGQTAPIALLRDDFTLPVSLRFTAAKSFTAPVRFTLRCTDEPPPTGMSFPTARLAPGAKVDRELFTAWQRHVAVQQLIPGQGMLHLGVQSHGAAFTAQDPSAVVRFVAAGNYHLTAVVAEAALVGEREFYVAPGTEGPIEVALADGRFAQGVVVDAYSGQPIAGAQVSVTQDIATPTGSVVTAADGAFRLGPIPRGHAHVSVCSPRHLDLATTIDAGESARIVLTPRPTRTVRGLVRHRPTLQPVSGAEVTIRGNGEVDVAGQSAADGSFRLATTADSPELVINARGYLPWIERIDELQEHYVCDLWLADAEARVDAGLTALLVGRVLGSSGKPVAGIPVQLFTDEVVMPEGIAGRSILEGHILPLRPLAITGEDGGFRLEWAHAGPVRLLAIDGVAMSEQGVPVSVVLGQRVTDLVLRARD